MAKNKNKSHKVEAVKMSDQEMLAFVYSNSRDRKIVLAVGRHLGFDVEADAENNSFESQGLELPEGFRLPSGDGSALPSEDPSEDAESAESGGGDVNAPDQGSENPATGEGAQIPSGKEMEV